MATAVPGKGYDDSVVIYDVAKVAATVFEDRSGLQYARPDEGGEDVTYEVVGPRSRGLAPSAHVVQADVYEVVKFDDDEGDDDAVAADGDARGISAHHPSDKIKKSPSTTELLDSDEEQPAAPRAAPRRISRPPPPAPYGRAPAYSSSQGMVITPRPVVVQQPSKWRAQSHATRGTGSESAAAAAGENGDSAGAEQKRPRTHHIWAYLACCLFFPLGIMSWIKAEESRKMLVVRNYYRAKIAGDDAKGLSILAIGVFTFLGVLFIIFYFTTIDRLGSLAPNT